MLGVWGALFQFYLDFSAYSDIAIGAAAMIGYELPLNFDRPFLSQSISEFWRRWHISLSTWFRDYVFFSLGGTRTHALGRFKNILVTMLLTGLWHGAGWNYVIWGGMHGDLDVDRHAVRSLREGARRAFVREPLRAALRDLQPGRAVDVVLPQRHRGGGQSRRRGVAGDVAAAASNRTRSRNPVCSRLDRAGTLAAAIHFTPKAWVHGAEAMWLRTPTPLRALALVVLTGILAVVAVDESPFIYFQF